MVLPHQLPKIPRAKLEPFIFRTRLLQKAKFQLHSLRNRRMDIRPLRFLKAVRIKSSELILPYPRIGSYIFPDRDIKWVVSYENQARIRLPLNYEQGIDGVVDEGREILRAKQSVEVSIPYTVTEPRTLSAYALVVSRRRIVDSVQKNFDIGLLRYVLKPTDEYPAPEGFSEDLTEIGGVEGLKKLWRDSEKWGPDIGAYYSCGHYQSGFYYLEDKLFRPPDVYPGFSVNWAIRNNLEYPHYITVNILPPTLGVVYEDHNHITWVGSAAKQVSIPPLTTRTYSFYQGMPSWMYGEILILNAVWTMLAGNVNIYYIKTSEFKVGNMIPPTG